MVQPYNRMCKRPCFHNDYLPCFNLSNVTLIDTAGKGVDRISETGIVANDQEYDLDCIIYATGFDFGTDYSSRAGYTVTGRNSLTLAEKWKDGPNTLYGLSTCDFPNYFIVSHIQSTTTPNYTRILMERAKHITYLIGEVKKRGARTVEPTEEAEKGWVKTIEELAIAQGGFFRECTPGYFTYEGAQSLKALRPAPYAAGATAFYNIFDAWVKASKLEGLEVDREVQLN